MINCIVKVTPPNGVPIHYASRHSSTMDAAIAELTGASGAFAAKRPR